MFLQRDESASPVCCLSVNLSLPEPKPNLTPGAGQHLIIRVFLANTLQNILVPSAEPSTKLNVRGVWTGLLPSSSLISSVRLHLSALLLDPNSRASPAHVTMFLVLPLSFQSKFTGEEKNKEETLSQSAASTMGHFCWHPFSYFVKHDISWPLLVLPPTYLSFLLVEIQR